MKYNEFTLGQIEAVFNKLGGIEGVKRFLAGTVEVIVKKLLERVDGISLPPVEHFVAKDHFVVDASEKVKVKISYLGDNFRKHFLWKVEDTPVGAEDLTVSRRLEDSFDPPIITDLGGEAKVEITLGQFFSAFAKQANGEAGSLFTNGYANIGYIRDDEGIVWAVSGRWGVEGWDFGAYPLDRPDRWCRDRRFLSR